MNTVTTVNLVVVLLAFFAGYLRKEFLLKLSFSIIFLLLALRYDFGNDYQAYFEGFLDINRRAEVNYLSVDNYFEPGWVFLCRLFDGPGFFIMVAALAAVNCLVYYFLINKNVHPKYYWLATFLYVFNPGLLLIHSSAMRQSLAIAIFLVAIQFIKKKRPLSYFGSISFASLFHSSALVLIPLYVLGLLNFRIRPAIIVSALILFCSLFFVGEHLSLYISSFVQSLFSRYEEYEGVVEIKSGIGLLYTFCVLTAILAFEGVQSEKNSIYFKIAIIGYFIMPLALYISAIARVSMYFQPALLVVLPLVLTAIRDNTIKIAFGFAVVLVTLVGYVGFFESDIYAGAFSTYKTIMDYR